MKHRPSNAHPNVYIADGADPTVRPCLTSSGYKVVLQKSTPPQIPQRILYYDLYSK